MKTIPQNELVEKEEMFSFGFEENEPQKFAMMENLLQDMFDEFAVFISKASFE